MDKINPETCLQPFFSEQNSVKKIKMHNFNLEYGINFLSLLANN